VTPLPYEVIDRMPAAKKLPMADIAGSAGKSRARSHCRYVAPLIRFIPDSLTYSVPLFLKRQCDRTLGKSWFFVGMAVGMQESDPDLRHHALVKMTAADIKGECAVPLRCVPRPDKDQ
jgi:hypothetical protein